VSPQELDAMVNHRSSDELQKFRRVILGEYICNWIALPLVVIGVILYPQYLVAAVSVIVLLGYLFYFYHQAFRQFKRIHFEDDMQTYLQRALVFLKTYVRHYKIICWASIIVGFVVGYFMPDEDIDPVFRSTTKSLLAPTSPAYLIGTIAFVAIGILTIHLYIKYLYQARINNLEKLLDEFSEA
jgi:Flp pilus assembly protein TadB